MIICVYVVAEKWGKQGVNNTDSLQKINEDVFNYDNWALFQDAQGSEEGFVVDERIVVYAEKMFEEVNKDNIDFVVVSQYNIGLILSASDSEWFARNSWRFGFVCLKSHDFELKDDVITINLRYVGVFPAEQIYYSGITPEEYATYLITYRNVC